MNCVIKLQKVSIQLLFVSIVNYTTRSLPASPESPQKKKRASKLGALELLEKKINKKADLKKMELELRKKELELRELQMEREHEEKQKREEERQKRLDLELAREKAILELLQKFSSNKTQEN